MDRDTTRDRYRLAVLQRATERKNELLDVVVSSILAELPEYANGRSPGDLEDIRAGVQHSIDLFLSTISRPRELDEDERNVLRGTGGQRARQGIPKPVVLASVKIAVRVGRTFLMTCTDVGDDAEALMAAFRDISELLDRFEDEACRSLAEGHDAAWGRVLLAGDRGEAILVDRLLEERFVQEEEVLAHAAEVGLSRHREAHVVVVTSTTPADEKRLRSTAADLRSLALSAVGPLRSTHRVHLPLLVQPRDQAEWAQLVGRFPSVARRHGTVVVWGEQEVPLSAPAPAYRSLRESLPFLAAATNGPGAVPSLIPRFHRVVCEGTPAERLVLLDEVLAPFRSLSERERGELLELLDALYETGGSSTALARHLHLHKNTVGNRIRRVRDVVGLDVRRPPERLVLETALRMRHVLDGLRTDAEDAWPEEHLHLGA